MRGGGTIRCWVIPLFHFESVMNTIIIILVVVVVVVERILVSESASFF